MMRESFELFPGLKGVAAGHGSEGGERSGYYSVSRCAVARGDDQTMQARLTFVVR